MWVGLSKFDAELFDIMKVVKAVRLVQFLDIWVVVPQFEYSRLDNILYAYEAINRLKAQLHLLNLILRVQYLLRQKLNHFCALKSETFHILEGFL